MSEGLSQMFSVLLVFALLGAALWGLRRGRGLSWASVAGRRGGNAKALEALEKVVLTPQHSVHLIRANGREWVVATHPQGCTVLREEQARGASA